MLQRRSGVQAVGDTVKGKISGSGGSSGRPRQGRSCSTQALKKGGEKSETEPDLSDSRSGVVGKHYGLHTLMRASSASQDYWKPSDNDVERIRTVLLSCSSRQNQVMSR